MPLIKKLDADTLEGLAGRDIEAICNTFSLLDEEEWTAEKLQQVIQKKQQESLELLAYEDSFRHGDSGRQGVTGEASNKGWSPFWE